MRLSLSSLYPNTDCHPHTSECHTLCPDKIQQIAHVYVDKIETYLSACLLPSSSYFSFFFSLHRHTAGEDIFYSPQKWKFEGHHEFAIFSIFFRHVTATMTCKLCGWDNRCGFWNLRERKGAKGSGRAWYFISISAVWQFGSSFAEHD